MINRILTLERRTRARPHDPNVWCDLAEARLHEGQRIEALAAAESAAQARVQGSNQWIRIGDLFHALELPDHARQMYLEACQQDRRSPVAHLKLGQSLLDDGNAEDAAHLFAVAVWLSPGDPAPRIAEAAALVAMEHPDEALEHLMQVVEERPRTVEAWHRLADLHLAQGSSAKAFAALRQGWTHCPEDRVLGVRLGRLLLDAGFARDAAGTLATVARHHREPEILDLLARAQHQAGERAAAIATLRDLRLRDRGPAVAGRLGQLLREDGQLDDAIPLLREALAAPTDGALFTHLSEALLARDRADQALEVVEDGLTRFPEHRRLNRLRDKARAALGQLAEDEVERSMDQSQSAFQGNLRQFTVADLMEFLRINKRTGALRLLSEGRAGTVHLFEGQLAGATTPDAERLGALLVRQGLLSAAQVEDAVAHQQQLDRPVPLGQLLLDAGLIDASTLRPILSEQLQKAIRQLLGWTDGHFSFEADEESPVAPNILFGTQQMMLDAFRMHDEEQWANEHDLPDDFEGF